jgi:hypothetical protein
MFIEDQALVYKQYDCLYYALTKNNGKIILKNYYFKEKYPEIKSFFFVIYEYDSYVFKQVENKNTTSLTIQNIELDYIVPLKLIGSSIFLFQYVFNYCIDYKVEINDIWDQLFLFFNNDFYQEKDCYVCIYNILYQLGILETQDNYIEKNYIYYKKAILEGLIKINHNHFSYLNKILKLDS